MPELKIRIVGVTFKNPDGTKRQNHIKKLDGEKLPLFFHLKREPKNKYDPNAIAVFHKPKKGKMRQLGYIGRDYAEHLAPIMDDGVEVTCEYASAGEARNTGRIGVGVKISWGE